jgi:EAL domain-containing protein (putative c-di-GMP-specific phosphodiesterase class I)
MGRTRTEAQEQVADLLRTARSALGLTMAFLSRLDEDTQYLEVVESGIPLVARDGVTQVRETSFCQLILDGELPPVIPDVRRFPKAMALPAARFPRLRSYLSVPVILSDGTLYGTFCAAGLRADRELQERDRALMEVLAHAAALIVEPGFTAERRSAEIAGRMRPLAAAGGPSIVLQPIVSLETGERVGVEALSRFPSEWDRGPDVCFAEAHEIGLGGDLELAAVRSAAACLGGVLGAAEYVGVNLSPDVVMSPAARTVLAALPLDRILLELSEHDPVADYAALNAVLAPWRAAGLRLAIDDVGAGFSSLRHIVLTSPDVIKLDRALVAGVSTDPVLTTLVGSLVTFAASIGASTVAEGIETQEDAEALRALGVRLGQGWFYGRPVRPEDLPRG